MRHLGSSRRAVTLLMLVGVLALSGCSSGEMSPEQEKAARANFTRPANAQEMKQLGQSAPLQAPARTKVPGAH